MRTINEQLNIPRSSAATFQQELYSENNSITTVGAEAPLRSIYSGGLIKNEYNNFIAGVPEKFACKRECEIKNPFNSTKRFECKTKCDELHAQTVVTPDELIGGTQPTQAPTQVQQAPVSSFNPKPLIIGGGVISCYSFRCVDLQKI
jgi:hypothetical protein